MAMPWQWGVCAAVCEAWLSVEIRIKEQRKSQFAARACTLTSNSNTAMKKSFLDIANKRCSRSRKVTKLSANLIVAGSKNKSVLAQRHHRIHRHRAPHR